MIRLSLLIPLLSLCGIPLSPPSVVQAANPPNRPPSACSSAVNASPVEVIATKAFCNLGHYINKLDNLGRSIINLLSSENPEASATELPTLLSSLPPLRNRPDDVLEENPSPTAVPTEMSAEALAPVTTQMLNFP